MALRDDHMHLQPPSRIQSKRRNRAGEEHTDLLSLSIHPVPLCMGPRIDKAGKATLSPYFVASVGDEASEGRSGEMVDQGSYQHEIHEKPVLYCEIRIKDSKKRLVASGSVGIPEGGADFGHGWVVIDGEDCSPLVVVSVMGPQDLASIPG